MRIQSLNVSLDERIMGAAKNDSIKLMMLYKGIHIILDGQIHDFIFDDTLFDQGDKSRTRCFNDVQPVVVSVDHVFISMGCDGDLRSDDTYILLDAPIRGHIPGSRFDDSYDRDLRKTLLQIVHTSRADCVAGNDDHLHVGFDEKVRDFHTEIPDRTCCLGAVRRSGSITEIYDFFLWQFPHKIRDTGQSAQSRVKKANRPVIHT